MVLKRVARLCHQKESRGLSVGGTAECNGDGSITSSKQQGGAAATTGLRKKTPRRTAHSLGVDVVHRSPRSGHEDEVQEEHRRSTVCHLFGATRRVSRQPSHPITPAPRAAKEEYQVDGRCAGLWRTSSSTYPACLR